MQSMNKDAVTILVTNKFTSKDTLYVIPPSVTDGSGIFLKKGSRIPNAFGTMTESVKMSSYL